MLTRTSEEVTKDFNCALTSFSFIVAVQEYNSSSGVSEGQQNSYAESSKSISLDPATSNILGFLQHVTYCRKHSWPESARIASKSRQIFIEV